MTILVLLSVLAAGVPMIGYLLLIRWLDRYEREPLSLVAAAFGWGALGAIGISMVGTIVAMVPIAVAFGEDQAMFLSVSLVAPLVEEPAKALFLLLLYFSRDFDNATDGFVYGAAAGLGFGMTENFLYFATAASEGMLAWVTIVLVRTLFTGLMHASATSMVGAALGWTKFSTSRFRWLALPGALLAAIGMHALWNSLAMAPMVFESGAALPLLAFILFPFEFLFLFIIFQVSLHSESRTVKRELLIEAKLGNLPEAHASHLASWSKRRRPDTWLDESIDAAVYIQAATLLAFRRSQHAARPSEAFYSKEVERLRAVVMDQLGAARPS